MLIYWASTMLFHTHSSWNVFASKDPSGLEFIKQNSYSKCLRVVYALLLCLFLRIYRKRLLLLHSVYCHVRLILVSRALPCKSPIAIARAYTTNHLHRVGVLSPYVY